MTQPTTPGGPPRAGGPRRPEPVDDVDAPTPPFGIPAPALSDRPRTRQADRRERAATPDPAAVGLLVPLLVGLAVAVVLGLYGRLHEPTGWAINVAGFSGPGYVKAWLATVATLLALAQIATAMDMWGRFNRDAPSWVPTVHRWSGRLAVLVTVPVVVHCLYALGFQYDSTRALVHSLAGCVFYGAFVTKMLSLTRRGLPSWSLPVLGGIVFTALTVLWLTSALWLFTTRGLHL